MDEARKRELRRQAKEQAKAERRALLCLSEPQLNALLDYLDERLETEDCAHSLRLTREWARTTQLDEERVAASLATLGGYCDCEVLANTEPESLF